MAISTSGMRAGSGPRQASRTRQDVVAPTGTEGEDDRLALERPGPQFKLRDGPKNFRDTIELSAEFSVDSQVRST
jgi:hypothetical protein